MIFVSSYKLYQSSLHPTKQLQEKVQLLLCHSLVLHYMKRYTMPFIVISCDVNSDGIFYVARSYDLKKTNWYTITDILFVTIYNMENKTAGK